MVKPYDIDLEGEKLSVESLVGTGSVGEVWRVRRRDGSAAALKLLLPHAARSESAVGAFEREAKLYQRILHPGIPKFIGSGRTDAGPYLLIDFVEGNTLGALLGDPIQPRLALRVARDVLDVLAALHAMRGDDGTRLGLVHRDLSPSNVLLGNEGHVKLADFGIAKATMGTLATTGVMAKGTLGYMSPEQARGEPLDPRSDLFSIGALLHEMLSGTPPYDEGDARLALARARAGDVRPFDETAPGADPALVELVDRALSETPTDRFPSAEAMRGEIERVAKRLGGLASDAEIGAWVRLTPREAQDAGVSRWATAAFVPASTGRSKWLLVAVGVVAVTILAWRVVLRASAAPDDPAADDHPVLASAASITPERPMPSASVALPRSEPQPSSGTRTPRLGSASARGASRVPPASAEPLAPATLDVGSEPSFAYVSIDGREMGATPLFGLKLTPGPHRVTVRREGLGSRTVQIDLRPGQRTRTVVTLP